MPLPNSDAFQETTKIPVPARNKSRLSMVFRVPETPKKVQEPPQTSNPAVHRPDVPNPSSTVEHTSDVGSLSSTIESPLDVATFSSTMEHPSNVAAESTSSLTQKQIYESKQKITSLEEFIQKNSVFIHN